MTKAQKRILERLNQGWTLTRYGFGPYKLTRPEPYWTETVQDATFKAIEKELVSDDAKPWPGKTISWRLK